MKLIVIGGAKHCGKDSLAMKLSQNSDCTWIAPYTDRKYPVNADITDYDGYFHMGEEQLLKKMEKDIPLASTIIDGSRYVFFEHQLTGSYVVLIGDDRVISYLKNTWDGELVTIKCHSKAEQPSEINILDDDEFDIVFNVDNDDYDTLEASLV